MGQLLSAQATRQIPTLSNAFFVGDILTKRDCSRLQQLASNVQIINMFGTTETQRAVSYFAIPPISKDSFFLSTRKDIMPAGSGMIDVQLLVVNRNDRSKVCGVGEMGEIYVRSGGLAEGYLGPPEVSAEKFIPNWFTEGIKLEDTISSSSKPFAKYWLGVRDRMYRTGDLGRYDPEGIVECTGRADDQIKIRGFRIELGEVDTHLSQHPLVRENVTLVRRDKDEEKVLVSYFVPMQGPDLQGLMSDSEEEDQDEGPFKGLRKYRRLIKSIREYLKKKLPSYSVPTCKRFPTLRPDYADFGYVSVCAAKPHASESQWQDRQASPSLPGHRNDCGPGSAGFIASARPENHHRGSDTRDLEAAPSECSGRASAG